MEDVLLERGLPANPEAERFVLGAIMTGAADFTTVAGSVKAHDFSLERHRKIFGSMANIKGRGEGIDRMTLVNELMRQDQLQTAGGMSYVGSLDDGLPGIFNVDNYITVLLEKSALRQLAEFAFRLADRAVSSGASSAAILAEASEQIERISAIGNRGTMKPIKTIVETYPGGVNGFLQRSALVTGIKTGFVKFDEMTNGLKRGELSILGARPSVGKTAICLNIAQHVTLVQKKVVGIFSLEMSDSSLVERAVCSFGRVDYQKFQRGDIDAHQRARLLGQLKELFESRLYIDDSGASSLLSIAAQIRKLIHDLGSCDLVIIDYLQLISPEKQRGSREQEVSAISRGLKLIAKQLNVPMLVLAQLSRDCEKRADKRPVLSDLRESGGIEQDADGIHFLFREEMFEPNREDLAGQAELITAKQRNGPIGTTKLVYVKQFTRFENRADDIDNWGGMQPAPLSEGQYV